MKSIVWSNLFRRCCSFLEKNSESRAITIMVRDWPKDFWGYQTRKHGQIISSDYPALGRCRPLQRLTCLWLEHVPSRALAGVQVVAYLCPICDPFVLCLLLSEDFYPEPMENPFLPKKTRFRGYSSCSS